MMRGAAALAFARMAIAQPVLDYFRVPKTGSTYMVHYFSTHFEECRGLAVHDHGKGCHGASCNASLLGPDAVALSVLRDPVEHFASQFDHMLRNFIRFEPAEAGQGPFYEWLREAVRDCSDARCRIDHLDGAYERVRARRNGALARLNVTTKDGPKPLGADHVVVLYPQALFVGAGRREIVCYSPDVSADVNAVLRRYGLGKCVVPPPDPLDRHANGDRNHEVHETAFSRREVCGLYPEDCRLFDEYCRH